MQVDYRRIRERYTLLAAALASWNGKSAADFMM